jgi:hypothetical protein
MGVIPYLWRVGCVETESRTSPLVLLSIPILTALASFTAYLVVRTISPTSPYYEEPIGKEN